MTTIAIVSDFHCGNRVGLTPPQWQQGEYQAAQRSLWKWYTQQIAAIGPVDYLFSLGDLIDGRQEKCYGSDLIVNSRNTQIAMSIYALKQWKAKKIFMVRGTPYHTGLDEAEDAIASTLDAKKIADRLFVEIDGYCFDLAHHINTGGLPHTRLGGLEKEMLNHLLWVNRADGQPKVDMMLRGHGHIYKAVTDANGIRIICPCLQLQGSKYGDQKCRGQIDIGMLVCYTKKNRGGLTWEARLAELPAARWQVHRG